MIPLRNPLLGAEGGRWEGAMEELRLRNYRTQLEREKLTIRHMIAIYCRGHCHAGSGVCADCGT